MFLLAINQVMTFGLSVLTLMLALIIAENDPHRVP